MFRRRAKPDPLGGELAALLAGARASRPRALEALLAPSEPVGEGRLRAWRRRHRRALRAPWVLALVVVFAEAMHLLWPVWWLFGPAAVLALMTGLLWRLRGERERNLVIRGTAPALLWVTGAWLVGPMDGWWDLVGLAGWALASWLWWRLQHIRSRIEVVDGSRWPWHWHAWTWRREALADLARVHADWERTARAAKIPGAKLLRLVADQETGYELHGECAHGTTASKVDMGSLRSSLRALHPIYVVSDRDQPWRFVIRQRPSAVEQPPSELGLHVVDEASA